MDDSNGSNKHKNPHLEGQRLVRIETVRRPVGIVKRLARLRIDKNASGRNGIQTGDGPQ